MKKKTKRFSDFDQKNTLSQVDELGLFEERQAAYFCRDGLGALRLSTAREDVHVADYDEKLEYFGGFGDFTPLFTSHSRVLPVSYYLYYYSRHRSELLI